MKKIVVLGAQESGLGTAILAKKLKMDVFVSELNTIKEAYLTVLKKENIKFESGKHSEHLILTADFVIKSPGIPDNIPIVRQIRKNDIPILSEIEFASRYYNGKIVGITGSNGKTTTTMMIYHLLKNNKIDVEIAGNIGYSFAKKVAHNEFEHCILEISSFQLDDIVHFSPHIAVITNITKDHLDRYDYLFEKYVHSKFQITQYQDTTDYLIYDDDDLTILKGIKKYKPKARLFPFSLTKKLNCGAYVENDTIKIEIDGKKLCIAISKLKSMGKHNLKNVMASSLAAQLLQTKRQISLESLENFRGEAHRMEQVLNRNGILYINDSKATNVDAAFYALECIENKIIWIVGGIDKGNDYSQLLDLVKKKVKGIICLGLDNKFIKSAFEDSVSFFRETTNMHDTVKLASQIAEEGDCVLLSPACASFDFFENYEDKGNQFKYTVKKLQNESIAK